MNEYKEYDEIDSYLFEYFENHKEVPKETIETVENAFEKRKNKVNTSKYKIQKIAMIIILLSIISTTVVFAKDIYNYIVSLFSNTTEAISSAVANDYVQSTEMEYVYNQGIGIKVDKIVFDKNILDISLMYKNCESDKQIIINEYCLKDDIGNIIYDSALNNNSANIKEIIRDYKSLKVKENEYIESILYKFNETINISKIQLDIKSLIIDEKVLLTGNWSIKIKIEDKFLKSTSEQYKTQYDKLLIEKIDASISATTLNIYIIFKYELKTDINNINAVKLLDFEGNEYIYSNMNYQILSNKTEIKLNYDIGKYMKNTNTLKLILKLEDNKYTEILLNK